MKNRKILSNATSLITSILLIIFGILAFISQENFSWALGIIAGSMLIGIGLVTIIYAIFVKKILIGSGWLIVQGALSIILGIVLVSIKESSVTIISFFLATYLLIKGIFKMMNSSTLRRFKVKTWWLTLITGALYFILGFLLYFFNEFASDVVVIIIGSFLIASGLLNIIELFDESRRENREELILEKVNKSIDDDINHIDIDFTKDDK